MRFSKNRSLSRVGRKIVGFERLHRHPGRGAAQRDISDYPANKALPTDAFFKGILTRLLALAAASPNRLADLRRYVQKWAACIKLGVHPRIGFELC